VRRDGTCDTDYHCVAGREECLDGWCRPAEFAPCEDDFSCNRETQSCRRWQAGQGPGFCMLDCRIDADCPLNHRCVDDGSQPPYCYFVLCGGAAGNGEPFEACTMDRAGTEGLCYPLAEGDRQPGGATGLCLEGGELAEGAECDAQAEGVVDQCPPGSFCFGDPDDPFSPLGPGAGRGQCAALCDPEADACGSERCINFSSTDEPRTPQYDETRALGMCLGVECDVLDADAGCDEGLTCRIYALTDSRGECRPMGRTRPGEPCEVEADCGPSALCANDGWRGKRCLELCAEGEREDCGAGRTCWRDPAWPVGACLTL
jgi:hypothetical protein